MYQLCTANWRRLAYLDYLGSVREFAEERQFKMTREPVDVVEIAGYRGGGCVVHKGAGFRIVDVEGSQIVDLFVLSASDSSEYLSPACTRNAIFRMVPKPGDQLYSNQFRPLATIIEDTSPGVHDMQFAPCDSVFFEMYGNGGNHANCKDNFFAAIAHLGVHCGNIPDPVNLFQNTPVDSEGQFSNLQSVSKPGDYVEFRAEMDLIVVATACSVDIPLDGVSPIGGKSTPVRIETFVEL